MQFDGYPPFPLVVLLNVRSFGSAANMQVLFVFVIGNSAWSATALDRRMAGRVHHIMGATADKVVPPLLIAEIEAEQTGKLRSSVTDLIARVNAGGRRAQYARHPCVLFENFNI